MKDEPELTQKSIQSTIPPSITAPVALFAFGLVAAARNSPLEPDTAFTWFMLALSASVLFVFAAVTDQHSRHRHPLSSHSRLVRATGAAAASATFLSIVFVLLASMVRKGSKSGPESGLWSDSIVAGFATTLGVVVASNIAVYAVFKNSEEQRKRDFELGNREELLELAVILERIDARVLDLIRQLEPFKDTSDFGRILSTHYLQSKTVERDPLSPLMLAGYLYSAPDNPVVGVKVDRIHHRLESLDDDLERVKEIARVYGTDSRILTADAEVLSMVVRNGISVIEAQSPKDLDYDECGKLAMIVWIRMLFRARPPQRVTVNRHGLAEVGVQETNKDPLDLSHAQEYLRQRDDGSGMNRAEQYGTALSAETSAVLEAWRENWPFVEKASVRRWHFWVRVHDIFGPHISGELTAISHTRPELWRALVNINDEISAELPWNFPLLMDLHTTVELVKER